jgi:hypothetical protein
MNVRLSDEQLDQLRERAERRGTSASAALRELLELGRALDQAERAGMLLTVDAVQLAGTGGARLTMVAGLDDDDVAYLAERGNDWGEHQLAQVHAGAVVVCTVEEAAAMGGAET